MKKSIFPKQAEYRLLYKDAIQNKRTEIMSEEIVKKHNHIYSKFHVKKWYDNGGRIYDKNEKSSRKIDLQKDFSKEYYYSENEPSNELEDRIGNFEAYIGKIIKKIDTAKGSVHLTGKEYELLKLYCVLCANRHHFSTEVIKYDESGVYQSNHYLRRRKFHSVLR